jgi:SAM-dependent methyltransferase
MNDNYKAFAPYYDEATFTNNQEKIELLRSLINTYSTHAKTILELGCGTGTIMQGLIQDYSVTGLDLSPTMLEVASQKVPGATFIHADMSDFALETTFDAVLCVFDSINHLLNFDLWDKTFMLVHQHLNAGGLFVFDVNTINKLDRRTRADAVEQVIDGSTVTARMTKSKLDIYTWHIAVTDTNRVHEEFQVPEVAYPIATIEKALTKFFSVKEKLTGDEQPVSELVDRVYFVCQKV